MNDKFDLLNPPSTDFSMTNHECGYLPDKEVRMHYKLVRHANKTFASAVIERGWRRFGKYYFHPICEGCNECKSLRILVDEFTPTKSQKKALKRNKNTKTIIQKPTLTSEHITLYNRYHRWKNERSGWNHRNITEREYFENFVNGSYDFGKEVLYYIDNKLVAVDLIDVLDDGISAIYFFHDPDHAWYSLGVYSLLYQIELAKSLNLKYIYLGYWVEGCAAFEYKAKFSPQEILDGFPHITQEPEWKLWEAAKKPSR